MNKKYSKLIISIVNGWHDTQPLDLIKADNVLKSTQGLIHTLYKLNVLNHSKKRRLLESMHDRCDECEAQLIKMKHDDPPHR